MSERFRYASAKEWGKICARTMDEQIDRFNEQHPMSKPENREFWLSFIETLRSTLDGIEKVLPKEK